MIKKLFGNKQFYKTLLLVSIPIVLSQLISQFVNMLDNLMVGQLSTAEFNAVSIANQFLFIFNLAVFGAISGPSIFATQYHGAKNLEGVKECIRYKWIVSTIILLLGLIIFTIFDDQLFNLFIHEEELGNINPDDVIKFGKEYLYIMLIGLFPFVLTEIYGSNLREAKQTFIPMISNIIAVVINLIFNYLLIFGKFGLPTLGIKGAAISTVLARVIACLIVLIYTLVNRKYHFSNCVFKKLFPKKDTFVMILKKSYLLLINEFLWATGMMLINHCFSLRGLNVVAATNIASTFSNLFGLLGTSVGTGVAVILGQQLGGNQLKEAEEDSYKYLTFSVFLGIVIAVIMFLLRNSITNLYKMDQKFLILRQF